MGRRAGQHQAPLLASKRAEPRERSWPTHTAERRRPPRGEQRGRWGHAATPLPKKRPQNSRRISLCSPSALNMDGNASKQVLGEVLRRFYQDISADGKAENFTRTAVEVIQRPLSLFLVLCCFYLLFALLFSSVIKAQFVSHSSVQSPVLWASICNECWLTGFKNIHVQHCWINCFSRAKVIEILNNRKKCCYISIFTVHRYSLPCVLYCVCRWLALVCKITQKVTMDCYEIVRKCW